MYTYASCQVASEGQNRKAGSFEMIVGKSTTAEKHSKRFGLVTGYDTKSKRRVYEVISKRFVKKQQMRWTKEGTHHLLQVRVLNDEWQQTFCRWYPGLLQTQSATAENRVA